MILLPGSKDLGPQTSDLRPLTALVLALCVGAATACTAKEATPMDVPPTTPSPVRKVIDSPVAGAWYPAEPEVLRRELQGYLDAADVGPAPAAGQGRVVALISPHAGYRYSGSVAAFGFKLLKGAKIKRVIVMGPSHHVAIRGIATTDATHWRTPLGEVPIDVAAERALSGTAGFTVRADAFAREHSVDMQIPFLQMVAPNAVLVPLVVGQLDLAEARAAGKALRALMDDETVVVASSDFTHYGPNYGYVPFRDGAEGKLKGLADEALGAIGHLDLDAFVAHLRSTGDTICGEAPIQVLLAAIPKRVEATRLKFDTSGRMTGDFENSVSYQSIAFRMGPTRGDFRNLDFIPPADQKVLLGLARDTLRRQLAGKPLPSPEREGKLSEKLRADFGVFVTLKKHGDLRGCIGSIVATEPLFQGVIRNTVNAAIHDPRFPPMTSAEEPDVDIEISVLTPPRDVPGPDDILVGRDGVILGRGNSRAVFLPQVAPEQGWDLDTMLTYLARKAGLPGDAWRSGASFQTFQAHVFGEKE